MFSGRVISMNCHIGGGGGGGGPSLTDFLVVI